MNEVIRNFFDKNKSIISLIAMIVIALFNYLFFIINFNSYIAISVRSLLFSGFLLGLIYLIILSIFKNTRKANIIMSSLLSISMIINLFKVFYTNDPILYSDFLYITDTGEIMDIVEGTFFMSIKHNFFKCLIFVSGMVGLTYLANLSIYEVNNKIMRVSLGIIPIIIFLLLLFPSVSFRNFMLNKFYDVNSRNDFKATTTNVKYYSKYGIFSGMYAQYLENMVVKPKGYSEKNIIKEMSNVENIEKSYGTPNIIVMFAESFWDISKLDEIKFDKPVTGNFQKLKEEGIYFDMISPSYGGISANVEFEFLTGANLAYYGKGYIPYMQLYTNDKYYSKPSIVNELNNNDYFTKIVAYTSPKLFNCGRFYKYIKVDETEYNNKVAKKFKKGKYVSDEHVVDEIIKEFDNKKKGQKEFYMTLTMQAHMPYKKSKYKKYDVNIKKSNLSDEMNDVLLSYAQGIYDTDKQLGRLYDYIKTLDEPTMIIFYGDHLPYLDYDGKDIINELKYFNTDEEEVNLYRKYNTQSLILANFDLNQENRKYISPDLLGSYVLNRMDINLSNYYKYLYTSIDSLPAYNSYVGIDEKGKIYSTKELPKKLDNTFRLREQIQYKYFHK